MGALGRCQRWSILLALAPLLMGHSDEPPVEASGAPPEDLEVYAFQATSRAQLLPGRRAKSQAGDLVIGNKLVRFVVGGTRSIPGFPSFAGYLLDAGRVGKPGDLLGASTVVIESTKNRSQAHYRKVEVLSDGRGPDGAAIRATGETERWPDIKVTTEFRLGAVDEHLVMTTTLENQGSLKLKSLRLGDYLKWTNSRTFFAGKGFRLQKTSHKGGWIARRGAGSSFAWFVPDGDLVSAVLASHQGSRYNSAMKIFVKTVGLAPGEKASFTRSLAVGQGDIADVARVVFSVRGKDAVRVSGRVTEEGTERALPGVRVRAYSPKGKRLASEADVGKDGRFEMSLRPGKYQLVAWEWGRQDSAPAPVTVADKEIKGIVLKMRPPGGVDFEVRDAKDGGLLPARLIFYGKGRTKTPKFVPEREDRQFDNVVYTHLGRGIRNIPPGKYRVLVTRGPEYTIEEHEIWVRSGQTVLLRAKLDRVVDTKGFIACDFHIHSLNSQDSLVGLEDRVRSLVAENVEFAVPTDHNHVTDYRPIIAALGVGRFLASVPGDEVTSSGFILGHFNVFPILPEVGTPGDGAFAYHRRRAPEIFAEVRARPGEPRVIQVNHPRLGRGLGYWNNTRWDGARGETAYKHYSPSFDAIEVFNGLDKTLNQTEQVLEEWFVLLSRGFRYTATGNSDSHRLGFEEVGHPRNFVAVSDDQPENVDPLEVVSSVRAGRVVVSNGPFVRVRAVSLAKTSPPTGAAPASPAGAAPSGPPKAPEAPLGGPVYPRPPSGGALSEGGMGDLVRAGPGGLKLEVEVQAAPWIDVRAIEVFGNGAVEKTIEVPASSKVLRYRGSIVLQPKIDTWYVVLVRGEKPLPTLPKRKASPFAFTNPIWVDATGDGVFTPPLR